VRLVPDRRPDRRAVLRGGVAAALGWGIVGGSARPAQAYGGDEPGSLIIAGDVASRSVLLLDPGAVRTRSPAAARWSWRPGASLADLAPGRTWYSISEAKWADLFGTPAVLTCASAGLVAVVAYPGGEVYWATSAVGANPHSVELLPNGSVAVAASDGGWVRLYAASLGPRCGRYAEVPLPGAHGLHWDTGTGLLWAVGAVDLLALACNRSALHPQLFEVARYPLPDTAGHDLSPVASDQDRFWVTTDEAVHQFSVSQAAFVPFPEQRRVDRPEVKCVGDDPATGQLLLVVPSAGNPCAWCTSTVELIGPDREETFPGAAMYKARWAADPAFGVRRRTE
jgi:hypothetical protein